jgi:PAS domain S-box-containing protein
MAAATTGWRAYAVAVALCAAGAAGRQLFLPSLGSRNIFVTFYPAVVLAALYGGTGAGILATVLSAGLASYYWLAPVGSLRIDDSVHLMSVAAFIAGCAAIVWLVSAMQHAQARAFEAEQSARAAEARQRDLESQRKADERYRIVADNTYDFEFWTGADREIVYASPSFERVYGRPLAELLANPGLKRTLVHPDDLPAYDRHVDQQELLRLGGEVDFRILLPDGSERWIRHVCRPVFDERGTWLGLRGSDSDITESRRAEMALARANRELVESERKLRAINETLETRVKARTADLQRRTTQLRGLALELTRAEEQERRRVAQLIHDHLQQILAVVRINLSMLGRTLTSPDAQAELVKIDALVGESLTVARSLTAELSPSILYRSGLAAALRWLGQWYEEKHGLSVRVTVDKETEVESEELRVAVFRCVRELLFNVVKHAGVKHARVRLGREHRALQVIVSDDGMGFSTAALRGREGSPGGFGLFGLRERLESLGGTLEIDSEPDNGTRVTILVPLPVSTETAARAQIGTAAVSPAIVAAAHVRVVVVDDHAIVRDSLVQALQDEPDIEIVGQATDGRQAVDTIRALRPDVVLMDISLPTIDGIEATRLVKAELPQVRVIGLSMHDDAVYRNAMREAGAVECLDKSSSPDRIVNAVRSSGRAPAGALPVSPFWRVGDETDSSKAPIGASPVAPDATLSPTGVRD